MSRTLGVIGLGLLGGSLAEAARRRRPDTRVLGVSSPETLASAQQAGLIDAGFGYDRVAEVLEQCDLAFFCTPIDPILRTLEGWTDGKGPRLKPGAVISDVGSTKGAICAAGEKAFPPASGGTFIGSHPMAGSEKTGIAARDPHLFENAAWILCPGAEARPEAVAILRDFVEGLGARSLRLDPRTHDAVIAQASHLPQVLATALAAFVGARPEAEECLHVAGGGFRDMTRLAASSFAVWEPILRTNKANLLRLLPEFRAALESVESELRQDALESRFAAANALRARLSAPRKGFHAPLVEILVDLEDKPGALLAALSPLARKGVNVLDLEILKVREGEEGVLMMGFRHAGDAETALRLLSDAGHKARLR